MKLNSVKMVGKLLFLGILGFLCLKGCVFFKTSDYALNVDSSIKGISVKSNDAYVQKYVLDNGMTILVREVHTIPKVSLQIWYDVGSRDEQIGQKGIAHLIEHMIFKGTKKLSESDINMLVHKLSGSCNAFTSYDYTGYLFDFPTQNWKEALPIMADCMVNCTFKDDMLNSEMKAVIQELKMYRDNYQRSLIKEMLSTIFVGHPYHYPVIGYKHDLWNVSGADLKQFYQEHYLPNNATLVVVGDVSASEVFGLSDQYFGSIKSNPAYQKQQHKFSPDILSKSVTLYRDVKQPLIMLAFVAPGARKKTNHTLQILEWVIGKGKGSRLHKKLVDELQIATAVETGYWDMFDYTIFFVISEPKTEKDIPTIEQIVAQQLDDISHNGITEKEFTRALKKTQMAQYSLLEDIESQAYQIGDYYLATGDENYVFTALQQPNDQLKKEAHELVVRYFRPSVMHKGMVLSLPEQEKKQWAILQKESDEEDQQILAARERTTPVEPPVYAKTIQPKEPKYFDFPKPQIEYFSNGLKVLYHHNANTPKVNIILQFKARHYFDPDDKQGLYYFVSRMLSEGTEKYTAQELADEIESRGMAFEAYPGGVSMRMLTQDLPFGLDILKEIITKSIFEEAAIEKVRAQILAEIKNFWDEPRYFSGQLIRENIYKGHPYSKNNLGTEQSIKSIVRDDLVNFYSMYFSPRGAKLAIVGDLNQYDIKNVFEQHIGSWQGKEIKEIEFPLLTPTGAQVINYPINRDQVVLTFARLSIDRKHQDFDKFLLFDQIFGGGVLGSMSSRLFQLREQTGLFYTIRGSSLAGSDEQLGMFQVKTIVSLDRLQEAEKAIRETIDSVTMSLTSDELVEARNAIINSLADNFASNSSIAHAFLYLDRYNLPADYFDNRPVQLAQVTLEGIQQAVKNIVQSNNLFTLRVGRVGKEIT